MGENSLTSAAQVDLREIRSATSSIPDSCAMVVYFDNSNANIQPQILLFDNKNGERTLMTYDYDPTSTDSTTMLSTLQFITQQVVAEEYALVLWSHGSGWLPARRTIGIDNKRNSSSNSGIEMEITTLRGVLENLGIHWEYIFYDACFMQCIEVAYELRHLTRWSIGSPAEIPANGAPYDKLMPYFFAPTDYAREIPECYHNAYANAGSGVLLSSVCSEALDSLAGITAQVLSTSPHVTTDNVQQYCTYASVTNWKSEFYDMGSCMGQWLSAEAYTLWQQTMEYAIPYRYSSPSWPTSYNDVFTASLNDSEHYSGLSLYIPFEGRERLNSAWKRFLWYHDVGHLLEQ